LATRRNTGLTVPKSSSPRRCVGSQLPHPSAPSRKGSAPHPPPLARDVQVPCMGTENATYEYIQEDLRQLGQNYVDLLLIHAPGGDEPHDVGCGTRPTHRKRRCRRRCQMRGRTQLHAPAMKPPTTRVADPPDAAAITFVIALMLRSWAVQRPHRHPEHVEGPLTRARRGTHESDRRLQLQDGASRCDLGAGPATPGGESVLDAHRAGRLRPDHDRVLQGAR
jgi:hypothetical protein